MSEALGNEAGKFQLGLDRDGQFTLELTDDAFDDYLRRRHRNFIADLAAVTTGREIQIPPRPIQPEQGEE